MSISRHDTAELRAFRTVNAEPTRVPMASSGWSQLWTVRRGLAVLATPERSLWLTPGIASVTPPGARFDLITRRSCDLVSVYLRPKLEPRSLAMTQLLRSWIDELLRRAPILREDPDARSWSAITVRLVEESPFVDRMAPSEDHDLLRDLPFDTDLETAARAHGVSPRTLQRRFEAAFGESFSQAMDRRRMRRALDLLFQGFGTAEIALELGYASSSAFAHRFRQVYGESVTAYRQTLNRSADPG